MWGLGAAALEISAGAAFSEAGGGRSFRGPHGTPVSDRFLWMAFGTMNAVLTAGVTELTKLIIIGSIRARLAGGARVLVSSTERFSVGAVIGCTDVGAVIGCTDVGGSAGIVSVAAGPDVIAAEVLVGSSTEDSVGAGTVAVVGGAMGVVRDVTVGVGGKDLESAAGMG